MGHTIIKPRPGLDFYLVWSSVVDNIVEAGTEAEVRHFYALHNGRHFCCGAMDEALDRMVSDADVYGTSATPWMWRGRVHRKGGWRDSGFVVHNLGVRSGWLERRHLLPFAKAVAADKDHRAVRYLRPFEDEFPDVERRRRARRLYRARRG